MKRWLTFVVLVLGFSAQSALAQRVSEARAAFHRNIPVDSAALRKQVTQRADTASPSVAPFS
jgi:protein-tyrosine-phosphatase